MVGKGRVSEGTIMTTAIISTLLVSSALTAAPQATEPTAAMVEDITLTVTQRSGDIEDLGDDQYQTTLWATGVLSNGTNSQNTGVYLTCLVDHGTETIDCSGTLGLGGNTVAIDFEFEDGDVYYAIDSASTTAQRVAWDKWFVDQLIHVLPPVDENGEPDTSSGSILSGNGPGAIIVWQGRLVLPYRSEWLIIVDGVIMNPEVIWF
jgi:hypothetical protein